MALNNIRTVVVPSIGKLPLAADPGSFTPSGKVRTDKDGRLPEDSDVTVAYTRAKLNLNIQNKPGLDTQALNEVDGEDIVITLEDGQVHMMPNAVCNSPVPMTGTGDSQISFSSATSERI